MRGVYASRSNCKLMRFLLSSHVHSGCLYVISIVIPSYRRNSNNFSSIGVGQFEVRSTVAEPATGSMSIIRISPNSGEHYGKPTVALTLVRLFGQPTPARDLWITINLQPQGVATVSAGHQSSLQIWGRTSGQTNTCIYLVVLRVDLSCNPLLRLSLLPQVMAVVVTTSRSLT